MAGMYGTPPFLVTGMPSDSEDFSTIFSQLLHSSSSSCMISKPKTLPPPRLSQQVGTAGFSRLEDTHRFGQLDTDSGSENPLKIGKLVASSDAVADSSSNFNFSDPYTYVPADVKETIGNELFLTGVEDSDENTSVKEHKISPENDPGDFICPVEKNAEASEAKSVPSRTSSKRSRAAEVHNLSEKRRRSRINEKMKALQNLIPNSNKTDKASMLDEAIEYLKQLQLQVQMLMMRNGLSLHPMCLPGGLQSMILPQIGLNFDEGNGYQNSTSGIASSANAETLVQPDFSLPKHYGVSEQPVIIPSVTNTANLDASSSFQPSVKFHVGHFDPSTSSKDALCDGTKQLHLDTTKIEKNPSSDVS